MNAHSLPRSNRSRLCLPKTFWKRRSRVVLFLMLLFTLIAQAQDREDKRIVFLQLRLIHDDITLVKSTIRPGVVKSRRSRTAENQIRFNVLSSSGQLLWSSSINDPSRRRLEFEDPDRPGLYKIVYRTLDTIDFTIRIPYYADADRIVFTKSESTPGSVGEAVEKTRSLGSVRFIRREDE